MSHALGYARLSTPDQDIAGQVLRLKTAGAVRTYEDVVSGTLEGGANEATDTTWPACRGTQADGKPSLYVGAGLQADARVLDERKLHGE